MTETVHSPTPRNYSVPGVTCGHCKAAIESSLAAVAGVERSEVDLEHKTVAVVGTASNVVIVAAIDDAGYDATLLDT
jgi:copper chaperone